MEKHINLLYIIQKLLQEGNLKEIDEYRNALELYDADLLLLLDESRTDKKLKYIRKKLIKLERENIYYYLITNKFKKLGRAFITLNYNKEFNILKTINNKNKEKVKEQITKKLKTRKSKKVTIKIVLFLSVMILLIDYIQSMLFAILVSPIMFPGYLLSETSLSYFEWLNF